MKQFSKAPSFRLGWWLGLLPVAGYFAFFFYHALDQPFHDDYYVVYSLVQMREANTLGDWFHSLTTVHNEHRIALTRLVEYLLLGLLGKPVNFWLVMLLGNLTLVALLAVLWRSFRWVAASGWFWLPVPLLLFSFSFYENTFWAMASVQNLGVLCFSVATLYFMVRGSPWAFGLAIVSTLTSGGALLVWGLGAGLLSWLRRWYALTAWLVLGSAVVGWYLSGLPPRTQTPAASLGRQAFEFLSFLGATAEASSAEWLAPLWGGLLLIVVVGMAWVGLRRQGQDTTLLFYLACTGFVVATAALAAHGRPDTSLALISRYKIYSVFLLVLVYLLGLPYWQHGRFRQPLLGFFIGLSSLLWVLGLWRSPLAVLYQKNWFQADALNYTYSPTRFDNFVGMSIPSKQFTALRQSGLLALPRLPFRPAPADSGAIPTENWDGGSRVLTPPSGCATPQVLLLCNAQRPYLVPLQHLRQSFFGFLSSGQYLLPDVTMNLPPRFVPPGIYRATLLDAQLRPLPGSWILRRTASAGVLPGPPNQ